MANQLTPKTLSIDMGEEITRIIHPPHHIKAKEPFKFKYMSVRQKVDYLINSYVVSIKPS